MYETSIILFMHGIVAVGMIGAAIALAEAARQLWTALKPSPFTSKTASSTPEWTVII